MVPGGYCVRRHLVSRNAADLQIRGVVVDDWPSSDRPGHETRFVHHQMASWSTRATPDNKKNK